MNYTQAEAYINGIQKFAKKNTLEHTKEYLSLLHNPQDQMKIIHVAGTNGKGSTCNYIKGLLRSKGYHVGMFTSPHLVSMRERIVLDEEMISKERFVKTFERLMQVIESAKLNHPTFFEFLFLMAMLYYGETKPDYLILETGLGGRLDATNACDHPAITIITEIGLDHQQYLGDTKEKIAWEKAGIIKEKVPVVYAKRDEKCARVIESVAAQKQAKAYLVDEKRYSNQNIQNKGIDFSYNSLYYNYIDISLPTYAYYQVENASLAILAFEILMGEDGFTPEEIRKAMKDIKWAGRMEYVLDSAGRGIFLDGAHNEDGISAFLETVPQIPLKQNGKRILLFSVVDDKAYENMIARLSQSGLFTEYIVANLRDRRGLSDASMEALFLQDGAPKTLVSAFESVEKALEAAKERCGQQDMIFCVGSLYLIGELKALLAG